MVFSQDTLSVGKLLQRWRLQRGISLGSLALRSGVHKSTLSRWERGVQLPSAHELDITLAVLGLSKEEKAACWRLLNAPRAVLYQQEEVAGLRQLGGEELLRALRQRAGVSQEEAGRAVGVSREMVSRWERGERWPNTQKLHSLCFALGATQEEIHHLTTRAFVGGPPLPLQRPDLIRIHYGIAYDNLAPQSTLFAWCLAARLGELSRKDLPQAQTDQAAVWGALSYDLGIRWGNLKAATLYSNHAIHLMKSSRRWLGTSQLQGMLTMAEIQAQSCGPLAAVLYLEGWMPQIVREFVRAWTMSIQADYLLQGGETSAALRLSQRAIELVRDTSEEAYRRRDYARHLIEAGQVARGLLQLQELQASRLFSERESAPSLLLMARALRLLGQETEALVYSEQARALVYRHRTFIPREYQEL